MTPTESRLRVPEQPADATGDRTSVAIVCRRSIERLIAQNAVLASEGLRLRRTTNDTMRHENAALVAQGGGVGAPPGADSSNSSKPPSSDGLEVRSRPAPAACESGRKTNQPAGRRDILGKPFARSTIPTTPSITCLQIAQTAPSRCPRHPAADYDARQVFDLPQPQPLVVTEHRAHWCRCTACGSVTKGAFPEGQRASIPLSDRITAIVVYLSAFQFMPLDRLATLMIDLFGVNLSRATIETMSRRAGERLLSFADAVRQLILLPGQAPRRNWISHRQQR